jgi:UDP-glucuronate decarboxylase
LGPFNLGNPQEMTIEEIAREVLACTNSASQLQFTPLPQDDPKRRKPNIDAAEKLLGWHPRVPLRRGLEATIAYFALQLATVASPARSAGRDSAMLSRLHLTGAIHQ